MVHVRIRESEERVSLFLPSALFCMHLHIFFHFRAVVSASDARLAMNSGGERRKDATRQAGERSPGESEVGKPGTQHW